MIPNTGQDIRAWEKRRNHLLISPLDDGLNWAINPVAQLLITGGAGFISSHTALVLVEAGH